MVTNSKTIKKVGSILLNSILVIFCLYSIFNIYLNHIQANEKDKLRDLILDMRFEYEDDNFKKVSELLIKGDSIYSSVKWIKDLSVGKFQFYEYHNEHYTVKGLIELRNGNLDLAYKYMIESGKVKSTPVLSSFGPRMVLANEFLLLGERQKTIDYLDQVSSFWKYQKEGIKKWKIEILSDKQPDFGYFRYKIKRE